jgi:predicted permease
MAIGVGLTTAMFALTDPYVLRPLPYPGPDELVWMTVRARGLTADAALPAFDDWQRRTDLFKGLAAVQGPSFHRLRLSDRGAIVVTLNVSPNLLDVLGLPGGRARDWVDAPDDPTPVLLARRANEVFPADAMQVGARLDAQDGPALRVAGLLPDRFLFPEVNPRLILGLTPFEPDGLIRITSWRDDGRPRSASSLSLIGRLQPGVTVENVREALGQPLPSGQRLDVVVRPLRDRLTGDTRSLALGALGAGLLVLLVCAGNVANLWMARSTARARERATRAALGARRRDLIRLWVIEALLVSTLSFGLGSGLAGLVLAGIVPLVPDAYGAFGNPALDVRAFVFALAATGTTAVFASIPVALQLRRRAPLVRSTTSHVGAMDGALRNAFVAFQAALAMVLTVGAALLGHSYSNLVSQDPGFDTDVLAVTTMYPAGWERARFDAVVDQSVERLRRMTGVDAVAVANGNIVFGSLSTTSNAALTIPGESGGAMQQRVSSNFFDVAGMTIVEGRAVEDADPNGVVINQALARESWPTESPIGHSVGHGWTVVGVVEDAYERRYDERPEPTVYVHHRWLSGGGLIYLVRGTIRPEDFFTGARRALFEVSSDAAVVDVGTLGDRLAFSIRDRTFAALVFVLFGVAAGAVTIGGLTGIVGFIVARRTREIAIRIAIGAEPRHVRRLVVRQTLVAAALGLAVGLLAGRWASAGIESLLYGIEAGSWTTPLAGAGLLLAIMTLAALVPARRATRLQPVQALRVE